MNLYIITDEFIKSAMQTSFRATVLANNESSARWLIGQRGNTFNIAEIAAGTAFCVSSVEHTEEGVLTIVHDNAAKMLSTSQFTHPKVSEDVFYEVDILDRSLLPYRDQNFRAEKWFAVKSKPKYLLRRAELEYSVTDGKVERSIIVHQKVAIDVARNDQWQYKVYGDEYKAQFVGLHQASLLELRSYILRAAHSLPGAISAQRELSKLWEFVRAEEGDGAIPVTDLEFFPGQKLFWFADAARAWVDTLPLPLAYESTVVEGAAVDIPGTNCQTL